MFEHMIVQQTIKNGRRLSGAFRNFVLIIESIVWYILTEFDRY